MKKLLVLLFSLFFLFSHSVFADDISDFDIEGISIGDSLLDYMTEDEILKGIEETKNDYLWLKEPYKYAEVFIRRVFPTYKDGLAVLVKNNASNKYIVNTNEKFSILSIRGMIHYIEDLDGCLKKKDEVAGVLSRVFSNADISNYDMNHAADPSGNSKAYITDIFLNSGELVKIYCADFEETFRLKNNSY